MEITHLKYKYAVVSSSAAAADAPKDGATENKNVLEIPLGYHKFSRWTMPKLIHLLTYAFLQKGSKQPTH